MANHCLTFNVDVNKCFNMSSRCIKIGPWGGTGVTSFDMDPSVSQITRVSLHTGDIVDSLEVTYVIDRNNVETHRLGGQGGNFEYTFELRPGEYIKSMVGCVTTYGGQTCISKLGFTTNLGKKHGPYGKGGGVEFSVPVVDGRITGFFVQFNRYLNGIGVYLAPN